MLNAWRYARKVLKRVLPLAIVGFFYPPVAMLYLITGVYDTCYAAMPKGPVHPGHVLLVPIRHSSQGSCTTD